jgi:hypothetical protein
VPERGRTGSLRGRLARLEQIGEEAALPGTLEWHEPASWDEYNPDNAVWPCPDHGPGCRATIIPSKVPVRFKRILQNVDRLND